MKVAGGSLYKDHSLTLIPPESPPVAFPNMPSDDQIRGRTDIAVFPTEGPFRSKSLSRETEINT